MAERRGRDARRSAALGLVALALALGSAACDAPHGAKSALALHDASADAARDAQPSPSDDRDANGSGAVRDSSAEPHDPHDPRSERDAATNAARDSSAFDAADGADACELDCAAPELELLGLSSTTTESRTLEAFHFHAMPIETGAQSVLEELGIRGHADGGGVRLALYADRSEGSEHVPDVLIASGIDSMRVSADENQSTTPRGFITLDASTRYWIVAITSSTPAAVYAEAAESRVITAPFPDGYGFSAPFPAVFPMAGATAQVGLRYSLYAGVERTSAAP